MSKQAYILFGVRKGESYPTQYGGIGYIADEYVAVAIFQDFDEAEEYISSHRLKNPNYSKHEIFFKDSLLAGFDSAYVYQKEIPVFKKQKQYDPDNDPWIVTGNDGAIFENERNREDW